METMKAAVNREYGGSEKIQYTDHEKPYPCPTQVLIRVAAVSLNASDKEFLTGHPEYIRLSAPFKPGLNILGSDIAGTVEAVGRKVSEYKPGDRVTADTLMSGGGLAEFVSVPVKTVRLLPDAVDFETGAALLQSGDVAWQGLFSAGKLKNGDEVLINGGGGSAGTLAIQLAKEAGAVVTAVDHTCKLDYMKTLGAERVLEYTAEDYTGQQNRYDLILDLADGQPLRRCRRALKRDGCYLLVGGKLRTIVKTALFGWLWSLFTPRKSVMLLVKAGGSTAEVIDAYLAGRVKPVIACRYPLNESGSALQELIDNRVQGKVIVTVSSG